MPLIPLPTTSYPVDSNLLYEIIRGINTLSDAVSKAAVTSSLNGQPVGSNSVLTITKTLNVVNNTNVQANEVKSFTVEYEGFSEVPVVVATPVVGGANLSNKGLSVTLTSVTTTKTNGFIRLGESGITTVGLNIIIVGIPSTYKR